MLTHTTSTAEIVVEVIASDVERRLFNHNLTEGRILEQPDKKWEE